MGNKIRVKSPTRIDLAGGTLDLWPLYSFIGGGITINMAIDVWTEVEIIPREDTQVIIESPDLKKRWVFETLKGLLKSNDSSLLFYQTIFLNFNKELQGLGHGFELTTTSQSPIGGGLGGSSSLTISLLKGVYQLLRMKTPNVSDLVHVAHNIEAQLLRTPTGTQDYFPAVAGGLNIIQYTMQGIKHEAHSLNGTPFVNHTLLVYTGRSHHSGLNNFEVLKSAVTGDKKVLDALTKIKSIAEKLKAAIENKKWNDIPELFRQEYDARIQLTPAFTSPEIEKLSEICLAAGASAVKICGAGGGGCVLVWVAPDKRERVVSACQKEKFQCLNAKPLNPVK